MFASIGPIAFGSSPATKRGLPSLVDRAVALRGDYSPSIAVSHQSFGRIESAIVAARDDSVADGCAGYVVQSNLAPGIDPPLRNRVGACAHVECRHRFVRIAERYCR